jgi:hypothetical protein
MKQEIMVTVDRAEFVEIGKRVTDVESDVLELEFHRTPENQEASRAPQMFMKNRNNHTALAVVMGVPFKPPMNFLVIDAIFPSTRNWCVGYTPIASRWKNCFFTRKLKK